MTSLIQCYSHFAGSQPPDSLEACPPGNTQWRSIELPLQIQGLAFNLSLRRKGVSQEKLATFSCVLQSFQNNRDPLQNQPPKERIVAVEIGIPFKSRSTKKTECPKRSWPLLVCLIQGEIRGSMYFQPTTNKVLMGK